MHKRIVILFTAQILIIGGCTSKPVAERAPAAIGKFPVMPRWMYLNPRPVAEHFAEITAGTMPQHSNSLRESFYDGDAPHFADVNAIFQDTLAKVKRMLVKVEAPDPQLVIEKSSVPNAMVLSGFVELPVDTITVDQDMFDDLSESYVLKGKTDGSGVELLPGEISSRPVGMNESDRASTVQGLGNLSLSLNKKPCKVVPSGTGMSFRCGSGYTRPVKVFMTKTAPYVFLSASSLTGLRNPSQLIGTLAHELAHYYLAHPSSPNNIRYYYKRTPGTFAFRPDVDPRMQVAGPLLAMPAASSAARGMGRALNHPVTASVFLDSIDKLVLLSIIRRKEFDGFSVDLRECVEYMAIAREPLQEWAVGLSGAASIRGARNLLLMLLEDCASGIKIPSTQAALKQLLSSLPEATREVLLEGLPSLPAKNYWQAFEGIETELNARVHSIITKNHTDDLALYTSEEEADVFAINFLRTYGLDPNALREGLANLVQATLGMRFLIDEDHDRCAKAAREGWMIDGKPYRPKTEDFSEQHQGPCYRLFVVDGMQLRLGDFSPVQPSLVAVDYDRIRRAYARIARALPEAPIANYLEKNFWGGRYPERKKPLDKMLKEALKNK